MEYRDDGMCFVCGPKNPIGLKLDFDLLDDRTLRTAFIPQKSHQGYANVVHGGILAAILDEVMVNLPYKLGQKVVTTRMEVTFRQPARVGHRLVFTARLVKETKRTWEAQAQARTADGTVVAEAKSTLMKL